MNTFIISFATVTLAEIGDKTQLLSLLLVCRYRKPVPVIGAIFFATLINHTLAAWLGVIVADYLSEQVLKWVVVISFLLMAGWVLIPDKIDDQEKLSGYGPFITSFIAFFIAEIGDKTQIATSVLAAQYTDGLLMVVIGTTAGMLLANVPVVLAGKCTAARLPLGVIRKVTAVLFVGLAFGAFFYS